VVRADATIFFDECEFGRLLVTLAA